MKMKNGMYLFAAAIVASTMGLTSCSNDEEVVGGAPEVVATKVTMGVYASGMPGKRSTADEVNFGAQIQPIMNVQVVPVASGIWQTAVGLGDVTTGKQTTAKEVTLTNNVNEFLVYGNFPENKTVSQNMTFETESAGVKDKNADGDVERDYKKPYPLMYFADINTFWTTENEVTADNFWSTSGLTWNEATMVGSAKGVKLSGVKYAMGVLAAGVRTSSNNEQNVFEGYSGSDWENDINKKMILEGIVISGQPTSLDAKLNRLDNSAKVYETAANPTLQTNKINFAADGSGKVENANIYAVVVPESASDILVSFRFKNGTNYVLHGADGDIQPNEYVYYNAKLTKDAATNTSTAKGIFDAAYTTLLNANISSWGTGTITPPETTDVFIGIEFVTEWAQGLAYDMNI